MSSNLQNLAFELLILCLVCALRRCCGLNWRQPAAVLGVTHETLQLQGRQRGQWEKITDHQPGCAQGMRAVALLVWMELPSPNRRMRMLASQMLLHLLPIHDDLWSLVLYQVRRVGMLIYSRLRVRWEQLGMLIYSWLRVRWEQLWGNRVSKHNF